MMKSIILAGLSTIFVGSAFAGTTTRIEARTEVISSVLLKVGGACTTQAFDRLYDGYTFRSYFVYVAKETNRDYLVEVKTKKRWTGKTEVTESLVPDSEKVTVRNAQYTHGIEDFNYDTAVLGCERKRQSFKSMIGESIN